VADPEFDCLPRPLFDRPTLYEYHDPTLVRLRNSKLLAHGWDVLRKGLDAFQSSEDLLSALERFRAGQPVGEDEAQLADLGLILGGDVVMLLERMAVASTRMPEPQTDESTLIMSFATAMVEEMQAKGTGWSVCTHLADFDAGAGADAARRAIASMGGQRASSGSYRVILGPQPVAELLEWIVLPGLYRESFQADASPFMGRFGQQIASENLYLYDDGSMPGFAGSRGITDEGLPTGRTDLIRDGHLVGLLSDYFNYRKAMNARRGWGKLGPEPGMVERGILEREDDRFLWVFRSRRYPTIDGEAEREVKLRIMGVLFSDEIPSPRDVVIICLADTCGIFKQLLSKRELGEAAARIDQVRQLDLIGQAVSGAMRDIEMSLAAALHPYV